jgi:hypothetical protein
MTISDCPDEPIVPVKGGSGASVNVIVPAVTRVAVFASVTMIVNVADCPHTLGSLELVIVVVVATVTASAESASTSMVKQIAIAIATANRDGRQTISPACIQS